MSNKHTPGPWKFGVLRYNEKKDKYTLEEKPFGYTAPTPYDNPSIVGADGTDVVGCYEYNVFNSAADARLIASAPDLLEAVKRLIPLAKVAAEDNSVRWHEDEDIVFALTAIAKATGIDPEKLD